MSELLLLKDRNRCPSCFVRRNGAMDSHCHNCGTRLFPTTEFDFQKYEDDGNVRYWWAFDESRGWVSRDHFMVKTAKPQQRYSAPTKIDVNYGRHTTPGEVAAQGGKIRMNVKRA